MLNLVLEWKPYKINLSDFHDLLKSILSDNYNGLICDEHSLVIDFKEEVSQDDMDILESLWNSMTEDEHG